MRKVTPELIAQAVARLCIQANYNLPDDVKECIGACRAREDWPAAASVLDSLIENYHIAQSERIPICQDTGVACVFVEMGQDVHIAGSLEDAVNEGVPQATGKFFSTIL